MARNWADFLRRKELKIAFYITGHGYGHAVRAIEIIKAVLQSEKEATVHIRSSAPQWLFKELPPKRCFLHPIQLDVGAVQENSFSVDKKATLKAYAELIQKKSRLIDHEVAFLQQQELDLVISDITPFAFDAAEQAGLQAVGVANFSWDWIYNDWIGSFPEYESVIEDIRNSYAKAKALFRLPFHGDMSVFPKIVDVPLVGRKASSPKEVLRQRLGFSEEKTYVLLVFRDADVHNVAWDAVERISSLCFVSLSPNVSGKNIVYIKEGTVPFPDLLGACDAAISKTGFSIVAECIINQVPILYVPRKDFIEDPILREGLQFYAVCEEMKLEELNAGDWEKQILQLLNKPHNSPEMDASGALTVAASIVKAGPNDISKPNK